MPRRWLVIVLFLVGGALVPARAGALPRFAAGQNISTAGATADVPRVAADARGDAVAVWFERPPGASGSLVAAYKPAGGTFGLPQPVYTGPAGSPAAIGQGSGSYAVAMNAAGEAVVAWAPLLDATHSALVAAFRSPGAASVFAPAVTVMAPTGVVLLPQVAVGPSGEACLAWSAGTLAGGGAVAGQAWASCGAGATFSAPQQVSDSSIGAFAGLPSAYSQIQLAIDGTGRAVVLMAPVQGGSVYVAVRPAGATAFTREAPIAPITFPDSALNVRLAADGAGDLLAVWGYQHEVGSGFEDHVLEATQPAGAAAFGAPAELAPPAHQFPWRALFDASGGALVGLSVFGGAGEPSSLALLTADRPAGGAAFAAPVTLTSAASVNLPALGAGPDGYTGLWLAPGGVVRFASRPLAAGTSFGAARALGGVEGTPTAFDMATDGAGDGVAAVLANGVQAFYDVAPSSVGPRISLPAGAHARLAGGVLALRIGADRGGRATLTGTVTGAGGAGGVVSLGTVPFTLRAGGTTTVDLLVGAAAQRRIAASLHAGRRVLAHLLFVSRDAHGGRHEQRAVLAITA
jgi:hypothetical protein